MADYARTSVRLPNVPRWMATEIAVAMHNRAAFFEGEGNHFIASEMRAKADQIRRKGIMKKRSK